VHREIDLIELAFDHAFHQVRAELKVPVPPRGPFANAQGPSRTPRTTSSGEKIFLKEIIEAG
jgi:hypothetical protein